MRATFKSAIVLCWLVTMPLASLSAWHTVPSNGTSSYATTFSSESSDWYWGWYLAGRTSYGSTGLYGIDTFCYVDPAFAWYTYNTGTTDYQSDGYRRITLEKDAGDCDSISVTYDIEGMVSLTGALNANNQMATPEGDAEHQCFGNVILGGLATGGDDKVNGLFQLSEGAQDVTISAGPVNVSVPTVSDDQTTLSGTDPVSAVNTVQAGDNALIQWRGVVNSRSKSNDGAEEASGTILLSCSEFSLTINNE